MDSASEPLRGEKSAWEKEDTEGEEKGRKTCDSKRNDREG